MSQAVSAAVELGVPDQLASGPRSVHEIAESLKVDEPSLYRLLRACADFEVFEERADRVFALTDLGVALRRDVPGSMRNLAMWTGSPADRHTWAGLAQSVRTGEPAFAAAHGQPFFEYLRDHPEVLDLFDAAMGEISYHMIASLIAAYDFSPFGTIVDVGGGRGAMMAAVLAANPGTRAILYDWPDVIAGAGGPLKDAGVRDRCELVHGDFFVSVPAGGDAYLLSGIVHAWNDEGAGHVLANCRDAMADGGRILLVEELLPEKVEPSPAVKLMDLNMFVLTGGRKRTETEFAALFGQVGLKVSRVVPGGIRSVVEAVRA
jgi:O-methyltransferase domain/Dimerisation domain